MYRRLKLAAKVLFSKRHIVIVFKDYCVFDLDAHCHPQELLAVSLKLDDEHSVITKQEANVQLVNELINQPKEKQ